MRPLIAASVKLRDCRAGLLRKSSVGLPNACSSFSSGAEFSQVDSPKQRGTLAEGD